MGYIERSPLEGMDILRMHSIRMTQAIQQRYGLHSYGSDILHNMGSFYDTNIVNMWIYPIFSIIHPCLGFQLLFALILTEWITITAKCLIPDDRPYWWFPTTEYSRNGAAENTIFELPETCEITSGFPSSNSAAFGAFSYIFFFYSQELARRYKWNVGLVKKGVFFVILFLNTFGMIGKMYLVTNFHYQLIFGFLIGCSAGKFAKSYTLKFFICEKKPALFMFYFVTASVVLFIGSFLLTSWDPFWTLSVAVKWCWNTHRILSKIKHNILFYAIRLTALTGGFLVGNNVDNPWTRMLKPRFLYEKVLIGVFCIGEVLILEFLVSQIDDESIFIYLVVQSGATFFHVISVTSIIPNLVTKVSRILGQIKSLFNTSSLNPEVVVFKHSTSEVVEEDDSELCTLLSPENTPGSTTYSIELI